MYKKQANVEILKIYHKAISSSTPEEKRKLYGELYKATTPSLLSLISGILNKSMFLVGDEQQKQAEDLLHELFLSLMDKSPKIEKDFMAYMSTSARNIIKNNISKKDVRGSHRDHVLYQVKTQVRNNKIDEKHDFDHLMSEITQLTTPDEQEVLKHHLNGYEDKDIAEKTGKSPKTIANKKSIAKKKIFHSLKFRFASVF